MLVYLYEGGVCRICRDTAGFALDGNQKPESGVEITYAGKTITLDKAAVSKGEVRLPLEGECYADSLEWNGGYEYLGSGSLPGKVSIPAQVHEYIGIILKFSEKIRKQILFS